MEIPVAEKMILYWNRAALDYVSHGDSELWKNMDKCILLYYQKLVI